MQSQSTKFPRSGTSCDAFGEQENRSTRVLYTQLKRHIHSLVALAVRALSVLVGFGITFFIARQFGPLANGQYALITQTAMFLSILAVGGIDMAVVREFSAAVARGIAVERATFIKISLYSMSFAVLICIALLIGGNHLLALIIKSAVPEGALAVLCMILVSRTLTRIMSAVLRSQKSYLLGQSVEVLLIPAAVMACIAFGWLQRIEDVLWCTAIAGLLTGLIGILASLRYTRADPAALRVPMRSILRAALPLWGVAIALNIADWYSLATVSAVLGVYDAGLYRVALQIGTVLSIVSMGLFSVFSAQISAAHAAGDRREVAHLSRAATWLSTLLVLPAAAVLLIFARPILALIGPQFVDVANIVRMVVIGQTIYTITGPSGLTLALTGHERVNFMITIISTGSLLIIAPIAAHFAGLMGVAGYVSLILVARNVASLIAVYRLEGINVMTGQVHARAS